MFESRRSTALLTRPAAMLVLGLALSLVLMALPERWTAAGKSMAGSALRPGQVAVRMVREQARRLLAAAARHRDTVAQLSDAQRELDQLRQENHRLRDALAALPNEVRPAGAAPAEKERLLGVECVEACVLGQQARLFLGRHYLLDAGAREQVEPNSLVIENNPGLIDRGGDAEIQPGQLALSGSRVWGMVTEVGRRTSSVRTVTEAGYRDLVRLGDSDSRHRNLGPQGILEGTGEPLARVRLIEVTEPVAVGDAVYTAAGKGILPQPLLYGHVVRVERPVGSPHWEIWMQPAVAPAEPERVAVLRTVVNPLRVARGRVLQTED